MTLREMQEKREKLVAAARAALEEIRSNTDEARATELEQRHDTIMSEFDQLEKDIAREERVARIEREATERREKQRPIGEDGETRGQDEGEAALTYRDAFYTMLANGGDPSALTAEQRDVLRSGSVEMTPELRAQLAGSNAAGGYTVPTELADFIIKSMKAWGPMYDGDIVTDVTTSAGNPIRIPTVDDTANEADARDEADDMVDDGSGDVVFGQKALDAYVFATPFIRFSFELAQDSAFSIEPLLGGLIGERLGRRANRRCTTGTGINQPNGIVTASSHGKTAAATAAVTWDELLELEHSVDPAYRVSPKCAYMFNDNTLLDLRKLKDGEERYVWQAGNVQQGVPPTLNGRRYHINQHMDSLAAAKRIMIFGDLGKYYVRKVGAPMIGVLRERFWPDLGIAGLIRFDGELGDTAAVKHLITAAAG
ncbi:MAG TPA: phage major capsid protein [Sphingomicrobium sp.]|nr:phage major capsid protein [Sphingomicrobium sp.]